MNDVAVDTEPDVFTLTIRTAASERRHRRVKLAARAVGVVAFVAALAAPSPRTFLWH